MLEVVARLLSSRLYEVGAGLECQWMAHSSTHHMSCASIRYLGAVMLLITVQWTSLYTPLFRKTANDVGKHLKLLMLPKGHNKYPGQKVHNVYI